MSANLEELMARLGKGVHPSLEGVEARVWRRLASRQREVSPIALWGWRSAAAAALVAIGLVVGGAASAQLSTDTGDFSARAALAPSTLLGDVP